MWRFVPIVLAKTTNPNQGHLTPAHQRAAAIAVVGLGYVGLPTAIGLASTGATVIGIDVLESRLDAIRAAQVDLVIDDADRLMPVLDNEQLQLTTDGWRASEAEVVLICVPTPVDRHQVPDLTALRGACASVVKHARPGQTIVLTSTSYVGTTRDLLVEPLTQRGLVVGSDVHVAFSPERIDPGNRTHLQASVPRVVGGVTAECAERAAAAVGLVASKVHTVSSPEAAELSKLYENTFRAVNIALANEMSDIAGTMNLDITEVIEAAATKPYGFMPFYPGAGVGGHCIPCDPHYLLWMLRANRVDAPLIETAMTRIAGRPSQVVSRALEGLLIGGTPVAQARIVVVGVSYKPNVEDCRESSALEIIQSLRDRGAVVAFTDSLVSSVLLHDGTTVVRTDPTCQQWDLAIVHTLHAEVDLSWLDDVTVVLDTTHRLSGAANRIVQ